MTESFQKLPPRLATIAAMVRPNAVLADVGTDHAYLPIFLLSQKHVSRCVCTDIHLGPCQSAKANLAAAGLSEAATVLHTDGLCGVAPYAPTDIVIAGMGGELIADILSRADFVQNQELRFYLQPMTRAEKLREYLWQNGFSILQEVLVAEQERIYQVLCVSFTAQNTVYSQVDLYLGKQMPSMGTEHFLPRTERLLAQLKKQRWGMSQSAQTDETRQACYALDRLIEEMEERRERSCW